jgi:serine protease inhibitor
VKTINKHYDTGGIFPVDFRTAFEDARLHINAWVEKQTNDRIKDLIPAGALDEYTRLVLTNAIYFKGEWSAPFKEDQTQDRDFTLAGGETVKTPIMHAPKLDVGRYGAFNADGSYFNTPMRIRRGQDPKQLYPKADGFAMIELPYKGDDLSMVVIAPNDPGGLPAIEEQLTPASLSQWIGQLKKRDTHVYLPKFKMETEYTLGDAEALGTLQRMGMVRAFKDPRNPKTGAQFQGMTTSTNPMEQLYISKVFHKAFVEVNEKGTEAAAATAVVMAVPASAPMDRPFTPEFKADRPFLFLIREKSTGSVLFLGRMMQP